MNIVDYNIFYVNIKNVPENGENVEHLSVDEVSEKWSISRRHIQILCLKGHINGAVRIGKSVEFLRIVMFVP